MEILFTKDHDLAQKWDDFVMNNDKGSHLILTDWLKSYQSYGFDYELGLIFEKGEIVGGYGAVIAKLSFFKFYVIPFGPIFISGKEVYVREMLKEIPIRAKQLKTCYCHINCPVSDSELISTHCNNSLSKDHFSGYEKGHLFKFVYASSGLNWIDLSSFDSLEALLMSFKSSVRRDIRSASRKGLVVRFLKNEDEIQEGYLLCLENAIKGNYSLRDWDVFKLTLVPLLQKGMAKFVACYKNKEISKELFY